MHLAERAGMDYFDVGFYQIALTRYSFLTTLRKRMRGMGVPAFCKDCVNKLFFRKGLRGFLATALLPIRVVVDLGIVALHAMVRGLHLVSPPGITLISRKPV